MVYSAHKYKIHGTGYEQEVTKEQENKQSQTKT